MFQVRLVCGLLLILGVSSQNNPKDDDSDEGRPYEFSFTIDGEQHRHEKKDVNGIVQGEFGFITADGIYHVTVYATDENGSFKILSMKNTRISEPLDKGGKPSTVGLVQQPVKSLASPVPPPPVPSSTSLPTVTPRPIYDFTTGSTIRTGCSSCGIVTKPPPGPLKFQNPIFQKPSKENGKPASTASQPIYENKPAPQPIAGPPSSPNQPQTPAVTPPQPIASPPSYPNQPQRPAVTPPPSIASRASYPNQPQTPAVTVNNIPSGLISKPTLLSGQPTSIPNTPLGPNVLPPSYPVDSGVVGTQPPNQILLAPGVNPGPKGNDFPTEQNPFGPHQDISAPLRQIPNVPQNPIRNEISRKPASVLPEVTVHDGVIKIAGHDSIPIKDKYPNMVNGLPEGIKESDISDLLYKFNYTVGFHGHYEKGLKDGSKVGGYFVNGRDGISRIVTYTADENGYHPKVRFVNLGLESEDTPKLDSEKKFGLKNFEFIWYPIN